MTTTEMVLPFLENTAQNLTSVFLAILGISALFLVSMLFVIALAYKSLLCTKIYTFIFEHNDWLLYKKAKKQGIQHYLNGHHLWQFSKEWDKAKVEYGVVDNNFRVLDESTINKLSSKYDELAEKYNYKEYNDAEKSINDEDVVLSLNMYDDQLYIRVGNGDKGLLTWEPMVKDILKGREIWTNGKTDNIKGLLTNPKMVVSF